MTEPVTREQLLREFAAAYERLIEAAERAVQSGAAREGERWGPCEVVAHLAGWEIMANTRIPYVLAGGPPAEFTDPRQEAIMNDAINSAFVTLAGEQPLESLAAMLRAAYRRTVALLVGVDPAQFQPGEYGYERTLGVIEHCQEHIEVHLAQRD